MSDCFDCKHHEIFSDEIGDEFITDGCVCHNEQAENGDRHLNSCWEYGGKENCPYKEI